MPAIPTYLLTWSPAGEIYELSALGKQERLPITLDSPEWFACLERIGCFVFIDQNGRYTVCQKGCARGARSWYAYVIHDGQRHIAPLGKREAVTQARLESVAVRLCAPPKAKHVCQDLLPPMPSPELIPSPHSATLPLSPASPAYAQQYLPATKLHAPCLRTRLVSRTHLLERVQQGVAGPLTLISTPAGFGKTTLLGQWLAESSRPMAWLSLELEDNDPTRFLIALIAALQVLGLPIGTSALAALRTLRPPSPDVVLAQLSNELLEQGADEIFLVLDDYHVITNEVIQRGMSSFVEYLPPHLHLLLATRVDPPFPLARMRARGQLTELRATDLRFDSAEMSAFLHHVMGLTLPAEAVAILEQRTEGWIAGLQLAALSLQSRTDVSAFLAAFSGSHRFVLEYLTDEVLTRQSVAVQTFLLHTCLLERLSEPLCDAVAEQEGSQTMLETLERMNLFVVALDEERHWYRYHPLFAEALRRHLQKREPALVPCLQKRASNWFEQHNMLLEAVQHALAIPDADLAARLIEPIALPIAFEGHISTVLGWLDTLPEALMRTHPLLCVYHALSLIFTNQFEAAEARVQAAEQGMQEGMPAERVRSLRGGILAARALLVHFAGDLLHASEIARQALTLLPEAREIPRTAVMVIIASAFPASGNVTRSTEQEIATACASAHKAGNLFATVALTGLLARLYVLQGKLKQAAATYVQMLQEVPHMEMLQASFAFHDYYFGWGDLLREWNDLDAAEQYLAQGIELLKETVGVTAWVALLGYTALARLQQACGNTAAAGATLDACVLLAQRRHFPPQVIAQIDTIRAQLALTQGYMAAAIRWADASGLSLQDIDLSYPRAREYLTLARIRIAQGRQEPGSSLLREVLPLLDRLQASAEACARLSSVLEILIVRALALAAQENRTAALATLEQALVLAAPEGYLRLFVDEGEPMLALLRRVQMHSAVPQYVATLRAAFGEPPLEDGASLTPRADGLLEPLTKREREVLRLILEGASNREIAQRLVLSMNTVKRHVYNLCRKLNVQSRAQAIIRARNLPFAP